MTLCSLLGAMLVIIVVHRHHGRVGLLDAFLLWKFAWQFTVPSRLVLKEETFRSIPAQGTLGPVSGVHCFFSNKESPSSFDGQRRATAITYNVWGVSWRCLINNSKKIAKRALISIKKKGVQEFERKQEEYGKV